MKLVPLAISLFAVVFLSETGLAADTGKNTFEKNCAVCHGLNSSTMIAPNLFGQKAEYLERAIDEFRSDIRHHDFDFMNKITKNLDPRQIKDLVAYLESRDPCKLKVKIIKTADFQRKFKEGQRINLEKQCLSCHSSDTPLTPSLVGQKATYLKSTLLKFKIGLRKSHVYPEMNRIAESLTQDEVDSVSTYLAGLREWTCRSENF